MESVGVAGAAQPANDVEAPASVVQAMPWRLKAAKRAPPCGVPLVRLPSSSSTARITFHQLPVPQPFEVKGVPAWLQVKALVAVLRERYHSRSRVVHAGPVPAPGRSRLAKSQIASEGTYDSQCTSLPQGPEPVPQRTWVKFETVAGVLAECL